MLLQLMKRDPAWRLIPWVTATAAALGLAGSSTRGASFMAGLGASVYIVVFMQVLPHQRATFFEAALPVSARDLYLARLISLLSVIWLPATAVAAALTMTGREARIVGAVAMIAIGLSLTAIAILSLRITQFAAPRWMAAFCPVPAGLLLVLGLTSGYGLPAAFLMAGAALGVGMRAWRSIPAAFQCAPLEASEAPKKTSGVAHPVAALAILRSIYTWQTAILVPAGVLWAASGDWLFAPMYAMMAYNQTRMSTYWMRALPFSRRALLAIGTVPFLLVLACGVEIGIQAGMPRYDENPVRQGDPKHPRGSGTLDVYVSPMYWERAGDGRIPTVQAPWGESYQPPAHQILGWTFYNPYAVGEKNSWDFQEWQFRRATSRIYGHAMTPREMAENKFGKLTPATHTPRMQILNLSAFVTIGLVWVWLIELSSWHRIMRLSTRAQFAVGAIAVLIPIGIVEAVDLFAGNGIGSLSQPALQGLLMYLSSHLPANLAVLAALACLPPLAWFWILELQASFSEIPLKPQQNQTVFGMLGSRP